MSIDSGMDLEEELLPSVGRDALHEYSQWTSFVEFVSDLDEGLGALGDSSHFGPFQMGESPLGGRQEARSLVSLIECQHGDVSG